MSLFKDLFGIKKRKEEKEKKEKEEKENYVKKLIPFKERIGNYEDVKNQLLGCEFDVLKSNVDKTVRQFEHIEIVMKKYGEEIGIKVLEDVFIDMSEEQFDNHIKYQIIVGKIDGLYRGEGNDRENPFYIRKEDILKNKTKVVRSNSRKTKNPNRIDYIFNDDKLVQIKKYK